MVLVRSGFGVAALAVGIVAGFLLYRTPDQANRLAEQAFSLTSGGRIEEALQVFSEQIRRDPDAYILYLRRGITQKRLGRSEEALADFDEALRRMPPVDNAQTLGERVWNTALPETHRWLMAVQLHTERADVLLGFARMDETLAALDTAIALNGRNYSTIQWRGTLRTVVGRFDDARADFDTILSRGNNVEALFGRALTHYLRGDWASAADDFAVTAKFAPQSGSRALWLLKSQIRAGQPIPLDQFAQLPRNNPAWPWIDAYVGNTGAVDTAGVPMIAGDQARRCDTAVALGEWLAIKDGRVEAAQALRTALTVCPPFSVPFITAATELNRLENGAQAPFKPISLETPGR